VWGGREGGAAGAPHCWGALQCRLLSSGRQSKGAAALTRWSPARRAARCWGSRAQSAPPPPPMHPATSYPVRMKEVLNGSNLSKLDKLSNQPPLPHPSTHPSTHPSIHASSHPTTHPATPPADHSPRPALGAAASRCSTHRSQEHLCESPAPLGAEAAHGSCSPA